MDILYKEVRRLHQFKFNRGSLVLHAGLDAQEWEPELPRLNITIKLNLNDYN